MKNLVSFKIGEAYYFLANDKGSKLRININYAKNVFGLTILKDKGDVELLKKQAGVAASHMMGKKAQKNLVEKLVNLEI